MIKDFALFKMHVTNVAHRWFTDGFFLVITHELVPSLKVCMEGFNAKCKKCKMHVTNAARRWFVDGFFLVITHELVPSLKVCMEGFSAKCM